MKINDIIENEDNDWSSDDLSIGPGMDTEDTQEYTEEESPLEETQVYEPFPSISDESEWGWEENLVNENELEEEIFFLIDIVYNPLKRLMNNLEAWRSTHQPRKKFKFGARGNCKEYPIDLNEDDDPEDEFKLSKNWPDLNASTEIPWSPTFPNHVVPVPK